MLVVDRKRTIAYTPELFGENSAHAQLTLVESRLDVEVFKLQIPKSFADKTLSVKWKIKNLSVKGSWTSGDILDKRFRTDWETPQLNSSISVDAPLLGLYDEYDQNVITIACSEVVHELDFECSLREEDNHFYCAIHFFQQSCIESDYEAFIYINKSSLSFSKVIQNASRWIVDRSALQVNTVPQLAQKPLYSTWYSFHQDLEENQLLEELKISKSLGYDLVIIDDGWQTLDNNRGYDYTGDWRNERFNNMRQFVDEVHSLDMAVMLWYSVPFCGRKSQAYTQFRGKFLTENHHWAPVFDPRFPEVRSYLVDIYTSALTEWDLDGFKLDFIDDFKIYPETEMKELNGRDTLSVAEGVNLLIHEIKESLKTVKENVLIEFRQKYISPGLRVLGNMFRAFDCPNDSLMNRVRTTDIKLICGDTAVHSDMLTWSKDAEVSYAALQFTSILFSVPQISVMLQHRSEDEIRMIKFFTYYWNRNASILLKGEFTAHKPLSNYPLLSATDRTKIIFGLYDDTVFDLSVEESIIDIVNGKMSELVAFRSPTEYNAKVQVVNCLGEVMSEKVTQINKGLNGIDCPPNGIITLTKI